MTNMTINKFHLDAAQTKIVIDALAQAIGENRGHRSDAIEDGSAIAIEFTRLIDRQITMRNIFMTAQEGL